VSHHYDIYCFFSIYRYVDLSDTEVSERGVVKLVEACALLKKNDVWFAFQTSVRVVLREY